MTDRKSLLAAQHTPAELVSAWTEKQANKFASLDHSERLLAFVCSQATADNNHIVLNPVSCGSHCNPGAPIRREGSKSLSLLPHLASRSRQCCIDHLLHRIQLTSIMMDTTPLDLSGSLLFDDLDVYSVPAHDDGHPLAVNGIKSENPVKYVPLEQF
jgi:hypothetical protein